MTDSYIYNLLRKADVSFFSILTDPADSIWILLIVKVLILISLLKLMKVFAKYFYI